MGFADLTKREREVLDCMLSGHATAKAIARELKISARTVEQHRDHARQKLGARTVVDLMRIVATETRA